MTAPAETPHHNWFYRRLILPILALLRMGATPQRLAWSIAIGIVVGLNPVLGTTTALCLAIAIAFRLNVVAAQLANHAMFPFEVALVIPLIRLASRVFHTSAMPLTAGVFMAHARHAPVALIRLVWVWEWHAFLLWLLLAMMAAPLIALVLTPLLVRVQGRIQRHQLPIVP
ncbi:MAG TPA: DUF2062 domain-containing protein [Acidobacteriaceae bacterium]|nr:DUF2062 domain-containing protein [Acidobacteriaceae bacterium]